MIAANNRSSASTKTVPSQNADGLAIAASPTAIGTMTVRSWAIEI
jgi:hypothetical protein